MTAASDNLYGLILAGGHSKRMGQDKSVLTYHGKTQIEYAYDLLVPFCAKVFVSNRAAQARQKGHEYLPQLHDLPQFSDIGPLGGILSAMTVYPQASWLIFACDLPFMTPQAIACLIQQRDPAKFATAFISTSDGLPEPLCAIWEAGGYEHFLELYQQGLRCPRKTLLKSDTHLLTQQNPRWLDNVNTPEEYKQARDNA